jgi:hypothetical protein
MHGADLSLNDARHSARHGRRSPIELTGPRTPDSRARGPYTLGQTAQKLGIKRSRIMHGFRGSRVQWLMGGRIKLILEQPSPPLIWIYDYER